VTVKLRATWNLPAGAEREPVERLRLYVHLPAIRSLPGLRRLNQLRFLRDTRGGPPLWWRGEELYFDDLEGLEAATASLTWKEAWGGRFGASVAGPRFHVFEVDEEFVPEGAPPLPDDARVTALSGIWQVPAGNLPEEVDPVYLDVHVPGVRALPRLRCHTVMRALDWPAGEASRAHRSAEVRFDSLEDFDQVFALPAYDAIRKDGFNASVAGPDVDIYAVEDEWRS
jgi:uncharacterized protein (TIGR02118 family)